MFDWLGISAVNSALLWGGLLIASPILIHLLSRRKFRLLDWAAMEFLLEAERRNRRRIRLEHLILLLLRCLAVLLIAGLVARLFIQPTGLAAKAVDAGRTERIVLIDDSPSMELKQGSKTVLEDAKTDLVEFVRRLAEARPGDTLTLVSTSQPNRPVLSGQYLTADKIDGVVHTIENLQATDRAAAYDVALQSLDEMLAAPHGQINRTVNVLTDLRRRDWLPSQAAGENPAGAADKGPLGVLKRLSERVDALAVVNVAGPKAPNLAVAEIALREKAVVANVPARFEVVVVNHGDAAASNVTVTLTAADSSPQRAQIDLIEPGGRAAVPFTLSFREPGPVRLRAEIPADLIPRDNPRFRAVRVLKGIPILLVDGKPSAELGQNSTFFLERALDPPGQTVSGNAVEVMTENQFEDLSLDRFQVIVLANLYRISEGRAAALEQWVKAGGGLVVILGDQIDDTSYNERLYAGGKGLLPGRLTAIAGDEAERRWVNLSIGTVNHPVLSAFEGAENPFLGRVKFFRFWSCNLKKEDVAAGRAQVLASLTDAESSPAIVERKFGDGRVPLWTSSPDASWNNWPADPSYLVTVLETARYMTRPTADEGSLLAGGMLRAELDAAAYTTEVQIDVPEGATATSVRTTPADDGRKLRFEYEDTNRAGFYQLRAHRHDGNGDPLLFAVNVDPTEGDLQPADPQEVRRRLGENKTVLLDRREFLSQISAGARTELWRPILGVLVLALCVEQLLGWWFGKKY